MGINSDYSRDYDPAAPVLQIGLSGPEMETPTHFVTALVDTGSDVSMFPADLLKSAGGRFFDEQSMRGVAGISIPITLYSVVIYINQEPIYGIRAIGDSSGMEPIIGRDVLNQLDLHLNGPALELWIA